MSWAEREQRRRAARALERNLDYQETKARAVRGREHEVIARMSASSEAVFRRLDAIQVLPRDARVLEVGSGAHGLIFCFPQGWRVGVDPVAAEYVQLFPEWQRRARTCSAFGEALPFGDGVFDVVLCDNVVDHAESPGKIVGEIVRVMKPGGLLYFTVNVHHLVYHLVSVAHGAWNAAGLRFEIQPFADHTVHLTTASARSLFDGLPLKVLSAAVDEKGALRDARRLRLRHPGDWLKRLFFKNALYSVVAVKSAGQPVGA
jgi:SAM-dependent methyltransferase